MQIQQVLVNLIRNAVEAMQEVNRCELLISVTQPEADKVQVFVVDTGPGLAPEVASKLFQPFVTTKENGMGIGLSVCRNIIDAHGGKSGLICIVTLARPFTFRCPPRTARSPLGCGDTVPTTPEPRPLVATERESGSVSEICWSGALV